MNFKKFYLLSACLLVTMCLSAQETLKLLGNWDYKRKALAYEKINAAICTTNGYVIAVGETEGQSYKDIDGLYIVIDAETGSTLQWKKIGRDGNQSFSSVIQNHDGTLTLLGYDEVKSGDRNGWIVDVDLEGELINREPIGGPDNNDDEIFDAAISPEGAIMAVGVQDIGKTNKPWIVVRSTSGELTSVPATNLPGSIHSLTSTADESFVVIGSTEDRDKAHPNQIWVMKIGTNGENMWNDIRYFGDKGFQEGADICLDPLDGNYVLAGVTNSQSAGHSDMWVLKIDEHGDIIWQHTYGGSAADVASCIVPLATGGYAILGHTWSHLPRTKNSAVQLILLDADGSKVDSEYYNIVEGRGDQIGCHLVESLVSDEVIMVANSSREKDYNSLTLLSTITYRFQTELTRNQGDDDTYGSDANFDFQVSESSFIDANQNNYLEADERGFVLLDVTNNSDRVANGVHAVVTSNEQMDLTYWDKVYLGSMGAGQRKTVRVPIQAQGAPRKGSYDIQINIKADGISAASTTAKIASNRPEPANLVVNKQLFSPEANAQAGQPITLTIEFENIGGLPTDQVVADLHIPAGVQSLQSERLKIPALAPDEKYTTTFKFSYQEGYANSMLNIRLETPSSGSMVGIKRSFNYVVSAGKSIAKQIPETGNQMDIIWTSHDLNEFRTIDVDQKEINIKAIALANKELSKRNFAVLINGRRAQGQKLDESLLTPPENQLRGRVQQAYTDKVKLSDGKNEIQIVYYDENGKEIIGKSTPLIFNYISKDAPNLYVLSIGVQHEDLEFTVNDAKAFASMYQKLRDEKGRTFKKVDVKQLVTTEATTENNIKRAFLDLSKDKSIKDNDLVVVFISSHGKVIDGDRYVLLPSDYNAQYEEVTTIDFNEDILKRLRSVDGNKLLFIDACHSGSAGSRSFSDAAASKMMNDLISATAGMEIFASCGDNEYSYEDPSWGNGAFTKAILEAFNNEAVDIGGKKLHADIFAEVNGTKDQGSDGVITIEELKLFVQQRVPHLVQSVKKRSQNPTNKSTDLLPDDMGIYLVN
ncbi:MAG: hypothetical protein HKN76_09855 [Saprospiraceae bacterium]|nr:hypothetical protein [Saprospiraceae bacterium]